MVYGSVCSGIEAATEAWHPLSWEAAFYSEIEPFPCAVLRHHYPSVPNLGDMTKFQEWPDETIDLLVGGTPCQSFSVAGLRKGLADPRGNLMLTYCAIAQRYMPRWVVWENVPGVLSSNGGRDFAALLRALEELGYGWAYRILDAQYFGVAQRRRRVFVVGYLGDWRRAAAVLFERESLCGYPAPSREKGQEVTPTIRSGAANGSAGHGQRSGDSRDELIVPVSRSLTRRYDSSEDGTGRGLELIPTWWDGGQVSQTLDAVLYKGQTMPEKNRFPAVLTPMRVRRLTPMECERLQGFPDGYTDIRPKGKDTPDGSRYKALGNSMAVPVMRWIGRRIDMIDRMINETFEEAVNE